MTNPPDPDGFAAPSMTPPPGPPGRPTPAPGQVPTVPAPPRPPVAPSPAFGQGAAAAGQGPAFGQGPVAGQAGPNDAPAAPAGGGALPPPPPGAAGPSRSFPVPVPILVGAVVAVVALVAGFVVLTGGSSSAGSASDPYWASRGAGPSGEPDERWTAEVGSDASYASAGTADGEALYLAVSDEESELEVVALDAGDGEERWTSDDVSGGAYATELTLLDGTLVASSSGEEDEVVALDPGDGSRRWRADGWWSGLSHDGLLPLRVYDRDDEENRVVVVSLDEGDEVWSESGSPVALCDGILYVSDGDETAAYDLGSGEERWSEDGSPMACDERGAYVLQDEGGSLAALDRSGEERWSTRVRDAYGAAALDGTIVVSSADEVTGLDPADGEERWSEDGEDYGSQWFHLAGPGRAVAVSTGEGAVEGDGESYEQVLFDPETGEVLESRRTNGVVYFASNLYLDVDEDEADAYDLDGFAARWSVELDGAYPTLVFGGDRLYAISEGSVQAFG